MIPLSQRLITIGFVCVFAACTDDIDRPEWAAFVYPDIEHVPAAKDAEKFILRRELTFHQCQAVANAAMSANEARLGTRGYYECGFSVAALAV